jgi:hypothetical protein
MHKIIGWGIVVEKAYVIYASKGSSELAVA